MNTTAATLVLLCLTGLAAADPMRMSDDALDQVSAGALTAMDVNIQSVVQQALAGGFSSLGDAESLRILREQGLLVGVGGQDVTIRSDIVPFLMQLRPDLFATQNATTQNAQRSMSSNGNPNATAETRTFTFQSGGGTTSQTTTSTATTR